jgi:hypothetical protein
MRYRRLRKGCGEPTLVLRNLSIRVTGAVKDALNAKGINVVVAHESKDPKSAAEAPALPALSATTRVTFPYSRCPDLLWLRGQGESNLIWSVGDKQNKRPRKTGLTIGYD